MSSVMLKNIANNMSFYSGSGSENSIVKKGPKNADCDTAPV
jgi:hypothetical protein